MVMKKRPSPERITPAVRSAACFSDITTPSRVTLAHAERLRGNRRCDPVLDTHLCRGESRRAIDARQIFDSYECVSLGATYTSRSQPQLGMAGVRPATRTKSSEVVVAAPPLQSAWRRVVDRAVRASTLARTTHP